MQQQAQRQQMMMQQQQMYGQQGGMYGRPGGMMGGMGGGGRMGGGGMNPVGFTFLFRFRRRHSSRAFRRAAPYPASPKQGSPKQGAEIGCGARSALQDLFERVLCTNSSPRRPGPHDGWWSACGWSPRRLFGRWSARRLHGRKCLSCRAWPESLAWLVTEPSRSCRATKTAAEATLTAVTWAASKQTRVLGNDADASRQRCGARIAILLPNLPRLRRLQYAPTEITTPYISCALYLVPLPYLFPAVYPPVLATNRSRCRI